MLSSFLAEGFFPFTLALGLLFGLLVLEIVFALIGTTLLGAGGDGMDGPDLDVDAPDLGDVDLDLDLGDADFDVSDFELPQMDTIDAEAPQTTTPVGGVLDFLGLGRMPAMIWLACMLMVFGLVGLTIQILSQSNFGYVWPWSIAAIPAVVAAFWFAKKFGALFARLLPKSETQSVSERHLGRRSGVVSQGTAARGRPAEVRVTDRYGNIQYLRAEPLRDDAQIPQGSQVLVLRHKIEGGYYIIPLPTA